MDSFSHEFTKKNNKNINNPEKYNYMTSPTDPYFSALFG